EAAANGNSINMEEYTTSVTRYISKCINYMTVSNTITTCSTQKLWMTVKRLVMRHIKTQLPPSLDPLQFVYHPNRSMDDAITTTLYLAFTYLDNKDSLV
ncbi:hypothetical protein QTP70_017432, partial [Hemibagrus guttatus]